MKQQLILIVVVISICSQGCRDFKYLNDHEITGVTLKGKTYTNSADFRISALATCKSAIKLHISKQEIIFPIENSLDTIIRTDWYGNAQTVRIEYDTACIKEAPRIGYIFYGSRFLW